MNNTLASNVYIFSVTFPIILSFCWLFFEQSLFLQSFLIINYVYFSNTLTMDYDVHIKYGRVSWLL